MRHLPALLLSATILCGLAPASHALRVKAPPPPLAASDVPALIEKLRSEDTNTQFNALSDIARVKPIEDAKSALPAIIDITKQKAKKPNDWQLSSLQTEAMAVLGKLPLTPETTDILLSTADITYSPEKCRNPEAQQTLAVGNECRMYSQVSSAAAYGLPVEERYISRIKQVLQHPSAPVREAIVSRFRIPQKLPKGSAEILKSLLIHDTDGFIRTRVAQVIEEKEKGNAAYAPALITAIKNEKANSNKLFYVSALANTGGAPEEELSLFIGLLESNENESTRYNSAKIIGQMGTKAADAIPALINSLKTGKNPLIRVHAAEALGKVASKTHKEATQALIDALKDPDAETQKRALLALKKQGNTSPEVLEFEKAK